MSRLLCGLLVFVLAGCGTYTVQKTTTQPDGSFVTSWHAYKRHLFVGTFDPAPGDGRVVKSVAFYRTPSGRKVRHGSSFRMFSPTHYREWIYKDGKLMETRTETIDCVLMPGDIESR